jgi:hypothetical protein
VSVVLRVIMLHQLNKNGVVQVFGRLGTHFMGTEGLD